MKTYKIHGNVKDILKALDGLVFNYEYDNGILTISAEPITLKIINKIIILKF